MPPKIPEPPFGGFDFSDEFLPAVDFGEEFGFGGDFSFLPMLEVDFLTTHLLVMSLLYMVMCLAVFLWRVSFHWGRRTQHDADKRSVLPTEPAIEQFEASVLVQNLFRARATSRNNP